MGIDIAWRGEGYSLDGFQYVFLSLVWLNLLEILDSDALMLACCRPLVLVGIVLKFEFENK